MIRQGTGKGDFGDPAESRREDPSQSNRALYVRKYRCTSRYVRELAKADLVDGGLSAAWVWVKQQIWASNSLGRRSLRRATSPMKVTYVSQRTWPNNLSGSEIYLHALAGAASAQYDVTLAATSRWCSRDPLQPTPRSPGFHVIEFPERRAPLVIRHPLQTLLANSDQFVSLYEIVSDLTEGFAHALLWDYWSPAMFRYLSDCDSDLIHAAAVPTGTVWSAWKTATLRRLPLVITPFIHLGLRQFRMRYLTAILCDAQAVLAVTPTEARALVSMGVPREKVHVVPLGIDVERFSSGNRSALRAQIGADEDDLVILIPRKAPEKGALHSIDAICAIAKLHRNIFVLLLDEPPPGLGPLIRSGVDRLIRAGVKVVDFGFLQHGSEVLKNVYAGCDVLLQPSSTESFGLVYLEAWASAKPVIAARLGAVPDVVKDEENGLLVTYGDVKEIAAAIERVASNREFGTHLGLAGKAKLASSYTISAMWDATNRVYRNVLDGRVTPP